MLLLVKSSSSTKSITDQLLDCDSKWFEKWRVFLNKYFFLLTERWICKEMSHTRERSVKVGWSSVQPSTNTSTGTRSFIFVSYSSSSYMFYPEYDIQLMHLLSISSLPAPPILFFLLIPSLLLISIAINIPGMVRFLVSRILRAGSTRRSGMRNYTRTILMR